MFTPWDLVRPRVWHPMASLEQSMMDVDRMTDRLFATPSVFSIHDHDDDFFSDLPVRRRGVERPNQDAPPQDQATDDTNTAPPSSWFSGYSFSSSSIVDDKGQRVTSTRRRYEDSSGRLKAMHEREIGGKKLRTVWNKKDKDDHGKHEQTLLGADASANDIDEFEAAWKTTPFGEAEAKRVKDDKKLKEKGESA